MASLDRSPRFSFHKKVISLEAGTYTTRFRLTFHYFSDFSRPFQHDIFNADSTINGYAGIIDADAAINVCADIKGRTTMQGGIGINKGRTTFQVGVGINYILGRNLDEQTRPGGRKTVPSHFHFSLYPPTLFACMLVGGCSSALPWRGNISDEPSAL